MGIIKHEGNTMIPAKSEKLAKDKDHCIPLAELKCMSPKRLKVLDLYLGAGRAARRMGEEPGRAPQIKSAHGRRPLFRPGS